MGILRLIPKNARRHLLRTGLTVLGMAIAVMAFIVIRTAVGAWYAQAKAASPNRLVTINAISLTFSIPMAYERKIQDVPGVVAISYAQWFGGIYVDPKNFFPQFAVEAKSYFDMYPEFLIPPDEKGTFMHERNACAVGRKLADRFGWKVGDPIRLTGTIFPGDWDFVVRAIYTGEKENTDESAFYFHFEYLDERMRAEAPVRAGQVGSFIEQIDDPTKVAQISDRIDALFKNSPAETKTQTEEAFSLSFVSMAGSIVAGLKIISIMVIGIILLVLANTMTMTARERIGEYAVLKTLGFRRPHIISLILGESIFIAILGGIGGMVLARAVVLPLMKKGLTDFFTAFPMELSTFVFAGLAALLVGVLAAIFPTFKALRTSIVDGLRIID
jgi:putative ABC transport system permease protein